MNLVPWPYRILALVLLLLAGIGFGYVEGISRESDRRDAQDLQKTNDAVKVRAVAQARADKESARRESIGAQRETSREQIRVVYRTIKEQADETVKKHPEFNDCGLDADGLRNWNAANSGSAASTPVSGKPDSTLPGTAIREIGQPGGSISEPYRGNGAGRAVPGSDSKAGRVRTGVIYD